MFVVAQQHHRITLRLGNPGKKFRLPDEFVTGADDGLLVDGRGDERGEFMAEAAFGAVAQRGNGGIRGRRRTGRQIIRQRAGRRAGDGKSPGVTVAGKWFERQPGPQLFIQPLNVGFIANQQIAGVIPGRLGGEGFEGDFGADAGDVAQRDADPASHAVGCGVRNSG